MLELLLIAIALVGSFVAGFYDLKTSNIPDSLCIFMIIAGLVIHSYISLATGDFSNIINSLIFGGIFLAFGSLMYFAGQWGGGDGELLVAIGVLLPTLSTARTLFPFSLSFFINSFFVGSVFSILYSLILAFRSPQIYKSFFKSAKSPLFLAALASFLTISVVSLFYVKFLSIIFFLISTLLIFWKFSKSIENGFYRRIPVSKLKVDDMIGEDIPRLKIYKRFIRGLTEKEVKKIKRYKRYVVIKEGIRYGLVFPLTLLITLLFGDIFLLLF